jgi:hypothetical protein
VSSSSCTEAVTVSTAVSAQLECAFQLLAREVRPAHKELGRRLGRRRVRIRVDDEVFDVATVHGIPRLSDPHGDAHITIETSRDLVRQVLAGRCSLADALRNDALRARGALRDLVALLAALEAFVHGAVRCEAMPVLFDKFQTERVA